MEEKIIKSRKGIPFFSAAIFGACILAGCAHFFYQHRFMAILQLSSFFLLGCLSAAFMQKTAIEKEALFPALYLAVALLVLLSAIYAFKEAFRFMDVFSLTAAFLLPNVVMEAWRMYMSVSSQQRPLWYYSKEMPAEPVFVYLENKPLRIQLFIGDNKPVFISSVAPLTLPLGMAVFYILKKEVEVNAGNWQQMFVKENGQPYQWLFYNKNYGFLKTYFKPDDTLADNKIKSNTLVVAKRIG